MKICPLLSIADPRDRNCLYTDCMLFNKAAAQCSIAIIAEDMRSASADHSAIAESLTEIGNELHNITNTLKGMV